MADLGNISKLKLPNGDVVHLKDNVSGYTTNVGTITGITMNGSSKGTSGVVDLGTVITAHQDISGKADKATSLSGYGITDAYTKTEVDGKISGVFHFKGSKTSISELPSSGNTTGDVWLVTADNTEHVWTGTAWEQLGIPVDLSGYVPTSRKVNNKALTGDITISANSNTTGITVSDHSTGSIYGVKSGANSTTTASKASGGNGTAPTLGTDISLTGVKTTTTTASKASGANSTAPSLTFAIDGTDSSQLNITWSAGSASTWSFSDVTVPVKDDSATAIPNVTSVGTASTWSFSDVTVPIRNDDATTIVTSATHTVNDSGHTHTLS